MLMIMVGVSFREDTECDTHEMLGCPCQGLGESGEPEVEEERVEVVRQEDQLSDWQHVAAPLENVVQDPLLALASQFVSYVMLKSFHSDL